MSIVRSTLVLMALTRSFVLAQPPDAAHHPFLWDREIVDPGNTYIPETAVVDSHNVLWVLSRGRVGKDFKNNIWPTSFSESMSTVTDYQKRS